MKIATLKRQAKAGEREAQYRLGEMLREDEPQEAAYWFQRAAEAGNIDAQYSLAEMFEEGVSLPQNDVQAFQWYLKAASMGRIDAYLDVGRCYTSGCGTEKNAEEAIRWLRHLADPRTTEDAWAMPRAQFWMSVIFTDSEHNRVDPAEAYIWLNLAAVYAPTGRDFYGPMSREVLAECRDLVAKKLSRTQLETAQARASEMFVPSESLAKKPGKSA